MIDENHISAVQGYGWNRLFTSSNKTQPRAAVPHDFRGIQHDRRLLNVHLKS